MLRIRACGGEGLYRGALHIADGVCVQCIRTVVSSRYPVPKCSINRPTSDGKIFSGIYPGMAEKVRPGRGGGRQLSSAQAGASLTFHTVVC